MEEVKEEISSKQINQQARRQSALGASDEEVGPATSSTDRQSGATDTVEAGKDTSSSANEAAKIGLDSRKQGGYCFAPLPTAHWLAPQLFSGTGFRWSVFQLGPSHVLSHGFSASALVMADKSSSGKAALGGDKAPSTNSKESPGPSSGVQTSYKRASGMPDDAAQEARPFSSTSEGGTGMDSLGSTKQPQKDKSSLEAVKDAVTPENMKGQVGGGKTEEAGGVMNEGGKVLDRLKEGVKSVLNGGPDTKNKGSGSGT